MTLPLPPDSEQALLLQASRLEGLSIADVAAAAGWRAPSPRRLDCGWIGRLMEAALGASAGPRPEPDFPHLGLELKTVPVGYNGKPRSPSFLCTVQLPLPHPDWQSSLPFRKLSRMLWIPIIGKSGQAPGSRRIGGARLFAPNLEQWNILRADWDDIMECLHVEGEVPPGYGRWLFVRPGTKEGTLHFCLRPALTSMILDGSTAENEQ